MTSSGTYLFFLFILHTIELGLFIFWLYLLLYAVFKLNNTNLIIKDTYHQLQPSTYPIFNLTTSRCRLIQSLSPFSSHFLSSWFHYDKSCHWQDWQPRVLPPYEIIWPLCWLSKPCSRFLSASILSHHLLLK